MTRLSVICFTEAGAELCKRLIKGFVEAGYECSGYGTDKLDLMPFGSLQEWTREQFLTKDAVVFIGAAGIAVRAVAPFLCGKEKDPAVVVIDDLGRFSISLLSGHLGGANELAGKAAEIAGGQAVITTATDNHGGFAVDLFAKEHGLVLTDLKKAKEISAAVLRGEEIGFRSDFPVEGKLPQGIIMKDGCRTNFWITVKREPENRVLAFTNSLRLIPKILAVGIGCRKGISPQIIEDSVNQTFLQWNLDRSGIAACASIDIKKEEAGICEYAGKMGIPFYTFSAETLSGVKGEFTASPFVEQVTGVDNVCERAALACVAELDKELSGMIEAGGEKIMVRKQALNGVTIAVAIRDWMIKL